MNDSTSMLGMSDFMRFATRRAEDMGVTVKWEDIKAPSADSHKTITFPLLKFPMSERDAILIRHAVIHEPLHIQRFETFNLMKKYGKMNPHMNGVWNVVEDTVMETIHAGKYAGDKHDIGMGINILVQDRTAELIKYAGKIDEEGTKISTLMALALEARSTWDKLGTLNRTAFFHALPPEGQSLLADLLKEGWDDRIRQCITPADVEQVTKELFVRIYPDEKDDAEPQPQKGDGKGEGEQDKEGKEAQGKGKKGKGEEVDGEDPNLKKINWKDFNFTGDHKALGGSASYIDWEGSNSSSSSFTPCPEQQTINLKDMAKNNTAPTSYLDTGLDSKILGNKVRKHIQILTRKSIITERLSGKIHNASLYRVAVPGVRGDWNKRIFKRKKDGLNIDTTVTVLVDWSGSMTGNKKAIATQCAQRLLAVFDRTLHIPTEVLAFGTRSNYNLGVIKDITDRNYTQEDIAKRFHTMDRYASGNQDADAVLGAYNRIIKRPEKRKILIVLSDGSPSDAWGYQSADAALKFVTNSIRKGKRVELHGIGILDSSVTRYYGNNAKIVRSLNDLNAVLLTTLKEGVTHE